MHQTWFLSRHVWHVIGVSYVAKLMQVFGGAEHMLPGLSSCFFGIHCQFQTKLPTCTASLVLHLIVVRFTSIVGSLCVAVGAQAQAAFRVRGTCVSFSGVGPLSLLVSVRVLGTEELIQTWRACSTTVHSPEKHVWVIDVIIPRANGCLSVICVFTVCSGP